MNLNIVPKACMQSFNKSPNYLLAWFFSLCGFLSILISAPQQVLLWPFLLKQSPSRLMPSNTLYHTTLSYYIYISHFFYSLNDPIVCFFKNICLSPGDWGPHFSSLEKAFCLVNKYVSMMKVIMSVCSTL